MDSFELSVDSISFSYGKGEPNIFTDLSFSVKAGDTLALLGRNGVGKSTLLSCLMCFQQVQSGHIYCTSEVNCFCTTDYRGRYTLYGTRLYILWSDVANGDVFFARKRRISQNR